MLVAVTGFGRVWRHRFGKDTDDARRFARAVYYNTTGVVVEGKVRQRPQICGYARFDAVGGFNPNFPSRMINRVFECAEPSVWMGYNKLLFKRMLTAGERPDCFFVVVRSEHDRSIGGGNGWVEIARHVASLVQRVCSTAGSHVADAGLRLDQRSARSIRARTFRAATLDGATCA